MVFKKLDDIEIDGVKITNIYRGCDYYPRTNGYNYDFYFHCDLNDKDEVYDLCKKAFPEGVNHVKWKNTLDTYAVDHDFVSMLTSQSNIDEQVKFFKKGCNWTYYVREGNDH